MNNDLCSIISKSGQHTLGDKLQQHVAATDHSMCTGRATSCSNKVRRRVAATNRFVCTGEFLCGISEYFCGCNKSQKIKSDWICATYCGDKFCCSYRDFHKNSPVHTKRFAAAICRRDMLLQLVAWCVPTLRYLRMKPMLRRWKKDDWQTALTWGTIQRDWSKITPILRALGEQDTVSLHISTEDSGGRGR